MLSRASAASCSAPFPVSRPSSRSATSLKLEQNAGRHQGPLTRAPATPPAPPSSQEPARRSHIHHSNTTQTRHSEPREESLFAFDFCRTSQLTAAESGETSTADATGQ